MINDLDPKIPNYYQFKQQHRNKESHINLNTKIINQNYINSEHQQSKENYQKLKVSFSYLLSCLDNSINVKRF